ncbi:putative inorganic carbon transporter subunit DabA [Micromonospora cathayae]|uniref:Probable inorganic carbon transporter subunit DabA n=1 Tax=Micromonospora cathayae TaxID=3028804 RepID=A0ABY7ZKL5_9ACTN|nr:putative inorganic carbon transporter subunit DabA [Micromonospora sp. HUAS 3]WDZ82991.1 Na-translocating system protein MpsB [Micromonospora sp. HUAS 3]
MVPDPRRAARAAGWLLAVAAVAAVGLLAAVAVTAPATGVLARPEVGGVPFPLGVRVDRFGALFVLLVSGIAAVVAGYARRYLDGEPGMAGFQARIAGAAAATLVMATAPSLAQFAAGWIAAGWLLVGLIGYHRDQPRVRVAVRRVRRLFLLGDVALVGAFALLTAAAGSADLAAVRALGDTAPGWVPATAGGLLLVAGMVRSAQVPVHGWLPGTLDAPTPVSAFLHAGMVNVAGFLMITFAPVVVAAPAVMAATLLVGLTTAAAGTLFAAVRTDVKGALARSTVAQMGFMLAQCGLGAFGLAAVHLVGHGVYKAYAFLSAGGAVQAQARAAEAPQPVGPAPVRRLAAATAVLVTVVVVTETILGATLTGLLSAALAGVAGVAALRAALADRRLPVTATLAVTATVAALAAGYLLAGRAATDWMGLPQAVTPLAVGTAALVLAVVALSSRSALRRRAVGLWWWAWRDGRLPLPSTATSWLPLPSTVAGRRTGGDGTGGHPPLVVTAGDTDADAARAVAAATSAADHVAATWPLDSFVAVNPLAGLERTAFGPATARMRELGGIRTHLPAEHWRQRLRDGHLTAADLTAALATVPGATRPVRLDGRLADVGDLRMLVLRHPVYDGPPPRADLLAVARRRLPARPAPTVDGVRTLAEILDDALGGRVGADVDDLVADWCAAHCGRPAAPWPVPGADAQGCWSRWRQVAAADPAPAWHGATGFGAFVAALPAASGPALAVLLRTLGVAPDDWATYLSRSLVRLPGWAGYARWSQDHPAQRPTLTVLDLLAVRLAYEVALGAAVAHRHLGVGPAVDLVVAAARTPHRPAPDTQVAGAPAGSDPVAGDPGGPDAVAGVARLAAVLGLDAAALDGLPQRSLTALHDTVTDLSPQRQAEIWLAAAEHAYRRQLRNRLGHRTGRPVPPNAPLAQAVFCIDVRSEGLRRHLEATGPVRTFGFAGFFGLPVRTTAVGARRGRDRCPALMAPVATVTEPPARSGPLRVRQAWRRAFVAAKANPTGAFAFVEVAGLLATGALLLRAAAPRRLAPPVDHTAVTTADLDAALTLDERVYYAEATLRAIGLTTDFAPLVLLCGHGATSANNPYAAALDCGACGGNRGGVSAHLAATVLNDPRVRAALAGRGITIPDHTLVLAAEHDTVTDQVRLLDPAGIPATHQPVVDALTGHLADAGQRLRAERAARLPDRPGPGRLPTRATDWAQVRPEWALAGNAAFIAAPRDLTAGVDLDGRVFLHSYDWSTDPQAAALEAIMTGPLVVATWINLQYYFSTVDPHRLGAGTKTVHSVLGDGLGVLPGTGGDLRTGLPWQSVGSGGDLVHEPLRLFALVQAPRALVDTVLERHPALRRLVDGGWLTLTVHDPHTGEWSQPRPDGVRRPPTPTAPHPGQPRTRLPHPTGPAPARPTRTVTEKEPTA